MGLALRVNVIRSRLWLAGWNGGRFIDGVCATFAAAVMVSWVVMHAASSEDLGAKASVAKPHSPYAPAAKETVLSFYTGVPHTLPSDVVIKKDGVHDFLVQDVQWEGQPFKNPIYYGVRTTRWLTAGSGAMLDFTHSKAIAVRDVPYAMQGTLNGAPAPASGTVDQHFRKLEASHGHNMLTLNGLLRLPSISWRFSPYIGMGAGISLPHMEAQLKGTKSRTYEYQYAGPVGQALAGIEVRFPRFSLFLEYKFTLAPYDVPLSERSSKDFLPQDLWRQFSSWLSGEEPPSGRLMTTFTSHQIVGGIAARIAPAAAH